MINKFIKEVLETAKKLNISRKELDSLYEQLLIQQRAYDKSKSKDKLIKKEG